MAACDVNRAITDLEARHHEVAAGRRARRRLAGELAAQRRYVGALGAWMSSMGGLGGVMVVAPILLGMAAGFVLSPTAAAPGLAMIFAGVALTGLLGASVNDPDRIRAHHLVTWPVLAVVALRRSGLRTEATLAPYRSVLPGRVVRHLTADRTLALAVIAAAMAVVGLLGLAVAMPQAFLLPGAALVAGVTCELAVRRSRVAEGVTQALDAGCDPEAIAEAAVRSSDLSMFDTVLRRLRQDG